MKRAVLVPNIEGFPSESMRRYAAELGQALAEEAGEDWKIETMRCRPLPWIEQLFGNKMASRHARWLAYPAMLRRRRDGHSVFHILDHSHANLAQAVRPGRAVVTCHDIIPLLAARGLVPVPCSTAQRLMFPWRVRAMRRCCRVIAISEATRKTLIEHARIPEGSIRVVHYGVNPLFRPAGHSHERDAPRADMFPGLGIPAGAFVVLQVATAVRYKNTPALLRALARIAGLGEIHLLRVGADMFPDEAQLAENLGLQARIHCAGRVNDDRLLMKFYQAADVLAFPSLWEGFGWPPLEAMACGLPVVCSTIPSLDEVVGGAGLRVAAEDDEALAAALRRVWTEPGLRSEMRSKGLVRASAFTWKACAQGTLAVYDDCFS